MFESESFSLFFISSFIAGWVTGSVGSPFDVIKSRMMAGKDVNGKKVLYKGIGEAVKDLYRQNGLKGFYGGYAINC